MDEVRALPVVRVADQDQVYSVGLEDRQDIFPHVGLFVAGVGAATFRVRRMVPVSDDPILGGAAEVIFQPDEHWVARVPGGIVRIQDDTVDVAVVKGVVSFGAGGHPPGFTIGGQGENIVVWPGLVGATGSN